MENWFMESCCCSSSFNLFLLACFLHALTITSIACFSSIFSLFCTYLPIKLTMDFIFCFCFCFSPWCLLTLFSRFLMMKSGSPLFCTYRWLTWFVIWLLNRIWISGLALASGVNGGSIVLPLEYCWLKVYYGSDWSYGVFTFSSFWSLLIDPPLSLEETLVSKLIWFLRLCLIYAFTSGLSKEFLSSIFIMRWDLISLTKSSCLSILAFPSSNNFMSFALFRQTRLQLQKQVLFEMKRKIWSFNESLMTRCFSNSS